jgi:hypothetical protein
MQLPGAGCSVCTSGHVQELGVERIDNSGGFGSVLGGEVRLAKQLGDVGLQCSAMPS